jgi:hypothetical protein
MKNKIPNICRAACFAVPLIFSLGFTAPTARANSITLGDVSAVPSGGGSVWTYTYSFANSFLRTGDFFTINDFGPATISVAPILPGPNWSFTQAATGPNSIPAIDSGSALNATFTWIGGDLNLGPGSSPNFIFALLSPYGTEIRTTQYTSQDHISDDPERPSRVIGFINAPAGAVSTPEGGSAMALLGFGLIGIGALRSKFKRA